MRGHITKRSNGSWAVVIDAGMRPVQRCLNRDCKRSQFAVKPGKPKLDACPRCGGGLVNGEERKRKWSTYPTKRDAERAQTKLLSAVDTGTYVEPTRATVASFLTDTWLPSIARTIKATTLRSYETHVEFHIAPHIGSIPLQRLSGSDLNALYHRLLTEAARMARA